MPLPESIKKAARLLSSANYAVVLTGAGISTESGIPDFRSPGTGLWEKEDPEDFTIDSFQRDPHSFYRRIHPLLKVIDKAEPNPGHTALADLETSGIIKSLITQNVDGLHQKAGSKNVLEVHGSFQTGTCHDCRKKSGLADLNLLLTAGKDPDCPHCGGNTVKPDVTLFGEEMPPDFQLAHREALKCDCMLVVGSSLQVAPVGFLPRYAKNLLIINRGSTPYDDHAQVVIREGSGQVLTDIIAEIENL
ncbi:SIR2 family NAD-dependent protein deacylase [Dethiobacter alkaliphilus]|uniref:protein acetyllysine N-acetyltransferase n=1 Tax=Dethiobacter alkaliphilus AHT 1 TaxID=555088 RepID=C0GF21_DETAL|nr:Sir2 family NAD-dependent protein deacetylase [Dethiobacter alkaliphilus]EEG78203.1 Silent information regulator protein Sir2 [Dethiobacter alkaliphilus AHT 1]